MVCTKKKFVHGKWAILGLIMAHPHNSGLALRMFFFLILQNERGQEVHEHFISCFLRKKNHLGQFDLFSL